MDETKTHFDPVKFPHRELTERIIGCFYDVYNELGFGFLESVYHAAMKITLEGIGLRAETEVKMPVYFRGVPVGNFEADLVVEGAVILEFKAV
jgi:GxxExxY protein